VQLDPQRHGTFMPNSPTPPTASHRSEQELFRMARAAIDHGQAVLAFQPVVQAGAPHATAFHEGLIRVPDSKGRIIPARDFMPMIEDTPLGRDTDTQALDFGCSVLARVPDLRLAINMSARSVGYAPWIETLERWIDDEPEIGPRLILEMTERSAMAVPELVVDFMDRWQISGICFALDDFGAGFTALRYFKEFFFDILKIDGQFTRGIAQDPDNRALTRAMLSIAHQFDMLCVAETVENADDARILIDMGMDCLQGHYFGAATLQPGWLPGDDLLGFGSR
jgi:EAL domain-containing protein (putative c-di-GMP-specific phosphodiesterase class I)